MSLLSDAEGAISRAAPPSLLWTDPKSGLRTMQHALQIDRGCSFEAALQRLQLEAVQVCYVVGSDTDKPLNVT